MRLIDADALIDKYGEWYTEEGCEEGYIGTIKGIVDSIPTIEPEQKWIPAWQEYPQDNRFVLVCNDDGRCAVAQYIGHEVDAYHPWQIAYCPYDVDVWEDSEYGKIIAWMDLPKPYREGRDDEGRSLSTFERLRSRILSR